MIKLKKIFVFVSIFILIFAIFSFSMNAITEDEVRQKVTENGKEAVTGNIFIWFLCAMAFLKVSQKIDSFMSSLGINVGHTGGNMLAEAVLVMRGASMGKNILGGGTGKRGGSASYSTNNAETTRLFSGGLAGSISRQFNKSAIQSATNSGGNVITKNAFQNSVAKGGNFANGIIGTVANGNINNTGIISGDTANKSMISYMGLTGKENAPSFSNVEIGGGRITGTEITSENSEGIKFGMYNADQYMEPQAGSFEKVQSVDGTKWYKQYAADTIEKTPLKNNEGNIQYKETLSPKLPPVPQRKDKV